MSAVSLARLAEEIDLGRFVLLGRSAGGNLAGQRAVILAGTGPVGQRAAVMLALWVVDGRWHQKWSALRANPVFWIFQAYFCWYVVSLAWTADMTAGASMVTRHLFFPLAALYFTVVRREHTQRYLMAFAAGVLMCEVLASYNWLQLNLYPQWPASLRAAKDAMETAPFVDRSTP